MQEMWVQSPGWEDPFREKKNGNPLQYSCLENSMDRGAWWAIIHGVTKSQTQFFNQTTPPYITQVTLYIFNSIIKKYLPQRYEVSGYLSLISLN